MRVLAIGAHPDDIEINCAGTLLKCLQRGDEVTACHMSDGDMGHVVIEPEELGKIRRQEAQNAAKIAGYKGIWGGSHDLDIYDDKETRDRIVKIIRDAKPDFIITHGLNDYMSDHTAVAKLVRDASFSASCPHYMRELGEATPACPIYLMSNERGIDFTPTHYVDISDVMDTKIKMIECHESQLVWLKDHAGVDLVECMKVWDRFRGIQCDAQYAEGFTEFVAGCRVIAKRLLP